MLTHICTQDLLPHIYAHIPLSVLPIATLACKDMSIIDDSVWKTKCYQKFSKGFWEDAKKLSPVKPLDSYKQELCRIVQFEEAIKPDVWDAEMYYYFWRSQSINKYITSICNKW
jgi:hypothetical protein